MNTSKYVVRSLVHHRRILISVIAGVAVATAVLTGALVVGDSVTGSLRKLVLDRLGRIHSMLVAEHFFAADVADRMQADTGFPASFAEALPVIWFGHVTAEVTGTEARRTRGVQLLGSSPKFWDLDTAGVRPAVIPLGGQIVLNQPLANDLGVSLGDRVLLRLPKEDEVAGDSVLADKTDLTQALPELEVVAIVPAAGLGSFAPSPTQQLPLNAYVDLATLQQAMGEPGRVNAVLVTTASADSTESVPPPTAVPTSLEDLGLQLQTVRQLFTPESADQPREAFRYYQLTTQRMVFSTEMEDLLASVMEYLQAEPVVTYLANRIERVTAQATPGAEDPEPRLSGRSIPYSTISGVRAAGAASPLGDWQPGLLSEPVADDAFRDAPPELQPDEMVVTSWTAEQAGLVEGDRVEVTYFLPETVEGEAVEQSAVFRVRGIVPLTTPARPYRRSLPAEYVAPPTSANDPDLTPVVEGVTDQESIDDWDPPFPFDDALIEDADEEYWDLYRTTPKAFVSLTAAQRLWSSRFGGITSYRIPASEGRTENEVRDELIQVLEGQYQSFGFRWVRLRVDGMVASAGTTPFNGLFLGFSFFLIVAALLLVSLLFRLMVEQRAREIGLLMAVGFSGPRVTGFFLREALVLSALGAVIGVGLGVGYAGLMLWGLKTIWKDAVAGGDAVSTPAFLQLMADPLTCAVGGLIGAVVAMGTIWLTCRRIDRRSACDLLVGRVEPELSQAVGVTAWRKWLVPLLLVMALVAGMAALGLSGEAQAGAFFAGGVSVLVALLLQMHQRMRTAAQVSASLVTSSLRQLASKNLARNPLRSLLTIGLLSAAVFLIVAVSAFRLPPTRQGTGGFDFVAESDRPIYENLDTPAGREEWFGIGQSQVVADRVVSFRVRQGDDASCRNLFQSQRPRLLGVPAASRLALADPAEQRFRWFAQESVDGEVVNPWLQLANLPELPAGDVDATGAAAPLRQPIPVVLDKNTAMYSLHLFGGTGQRFSLDYGDGHQLEFLVVGLLDNSVLQGMLLVAEERLLEVFPEVTGYQYFLVDGPDDELDRLREAWETLLGDRGMDLQDARDVLRSLYAIQNTYLSTFQSLGGLGLLLGTVGLGVVQIRNVLERRGELGLLYALGFTRQRLGRLVFTEHFLLLGWGLLFGCAAAAWVVLPHWWAGGATIPWPGLLMTLGLVLAVGTISGWVAVQRGVMRESPIAGLRD